MALVLEPTNAVINGDMTETKSLIEKTKAKNINDQPHLVPAKPIRRRVPIQDIKQTLDEIPAAAEKASILESSSTVSVEVGIPKDIVNESISTSTSPKTGDDLKRPKEPKKMPTQKVSIKELGNNIKSLYDFEREWKSLADNEESRFHLLLSCLSQERIHTIFKSSFEVGYLNDFMSLIVNFFLPLGHFMEVSLLLTSIGTLPRIKTVLLLLSKSKKIGIYFFSTVAYFDRVADYCKRI